MNEEFTKLLTEDISLREECNLCRETLLGIGQKTNYGSVIIFKIGDSFKNGWFATLSPKTGSDPEKDFTIQLMPFAHLTHFCQIESYPELAKNYGIAFAKISKAMTQIMAEDPNFNSTSDLKNKAVSVATYGKSTNWREKKEHLHIKIFPFRGDIGQPYTVDSSFGRKDIHVDSETNEEFIKMKPVKKVMIDEVRFEQLSKKIIDLLR
jgi:hypothetical protein